MVSRLQQALCIALLTLLLVCCWLAWTRPTLAAWSWAVLLISTYPLVLAGEFVLLHRSLDGSTSPRPTARDLVRAWAGEVRHGTAVFFWRQPFRSAAIPDDLEAGAGKRRGIVFVHGLFCNRGFWTPWLLKAREKSLPFMAIDLETVTGSIDGYVDRLDDAIRRMTHATGHPPVLVCHSMGGLVARAWLRSSREAPTRVARVVTIASPHAGTWMARFGHGTNARQMRRQSPWLQRLSETETATQRSLFVCWYSNTDNIVFPASTATLPDADNRPVPGLAHVALAFEARVMQESLELVRRPLARDSILPSVRVELGTITTATGNHHE